MPCVSVIIANFNGARHIGAALKSVREQTMPDMEIIVIDDASTDDSVEIARRHAALDPRVQVLEKKTNEGPAACRNAGLLIARGSWIAVFDSDDLMHSSRLARLLAAAEATGADIVADNILVFDEDDLTPPHALLASTDENWIDLPAYIRANRLYRSGAAFGYLKPLIRASALQTNHVRYNETMRIAEDYDLIARLLAAGCRFRLIPDMTYFYRKHGSSISHRLTEANIAAMALADDTFRSAFRSLSAPAMSALEERRRSLQTALAFDGLVAALKVRRWADAARMAWSAPRAALLLRMPVAARLQRLGSMRATRRRDRRPSVVLLSRQRVVGPSNGSSVYLLGLCQSLVKADLQVHLICPSPAVFGRWPALLMRREMTMFTSITVRGGWRIGRLIIATDPRRAIHAGLTVFRRGLERAGFRFGRRPAPAPYAVAVPWSNADYLYVAQHARPLADVMLADYAFLTDGFEYGLRPEALRCVIMHDCFSSRSSQFASAGIEDSVATLDVATEMRLLGQAGLIVAIQANEAEIVQRRLPHRPVIVAPMAARCVAAAQPGQGASLLFIGSNTRPNVAGLQWFFDQVWPLVRLAAPNATLDISPLLQGSGLKIKLIEALGQGKAIVATPATVQGVESLVAGIVPVTDDAVCFADEVLDLLGSPASRRARGEAALQVARRHFSAESCYGQFAGAIASAAGGLPISSSPKGDLFRRLCAGHHAGVLPFRKPELCQR